MLKYYLVAEQIYTFGICKCPRPSRWSRSTPVCEHAIWSRLETGEAELKIVRGYPRVGSAKAQRTRLNGLGHRAKVFEADLYRCYEVDADVEEKFVVAERTMLAAGKEADALQEQIKNPTKKRKAKKCPTRSTK